MLILSLLFCQVPFIFSTKAQNFDVHSNSSNEIEAGSSVFVFKRSSSGKHNRNLFGNPENRRTAKQREEQRKRINSQVRTVLPESGNSRRQLRVREMPTPTVKTVLSLTERLKAADKAFKEGEKFDTRGENLKAIEFYKKSLNFNPKNEVVLTALADAYLRHGNKLYKENNFENAVKFLEEAAKLDSDNADIFAKLGDAYDELKKNNLAIQNYERALTLNSKLTEIYFPLAELHFENKNLAAADAFIQIYLLQADKNSEAFNLLGIIRTNQTRYQEAVEQFNRAINLKNDFAEAYHNLGDALDQLDRDKEAANAFQKAITLYKATNPPSPRLAEAYFDLGVANYNRKRYNEAQAAYSQAVALKPDFYEAEKNLAETFRQMEKYQEAVNTYRNLLGRSKNRDKTELADIYSSFGFCAGKLSLWKESIEMLKKSVEIEPDSTDYANLGWAYNNAGEISKNETYFREAKKALEQSIQINGGAAPAHYNLGVALAALKEYPQAIAAFRTALELRKDWAEAQKALGAALLKNGKAEEAVKELRRALKLREDRGQDFPQARFELGVALLNTGKIKEAREQQEKLKINDAARAAELDEMIKSYNPNAPKTVSAQTVPVPTPTPTGKRVAPKSPPKN